MSENTITVKPDEDRIELVFLGDKESKINVSPTYVIEASNQNKTLYIDKNPNSRFTIKDGFIMITYFTGNYEATGEWAQVQFDEHGNWYLQIKSSGAKIKVGCKAVKVIK